MWMAKSVKLLTVSEKLLTVSKNLLTVSNNLLTVSKKLLTVRKKLLTVRRNYWRKNIPCVHESFLETNQICWRSAIFYWRSAIFCWRSVIIYCRSAIFYWRSAFFYLRGENLAGSFASTNRATNLAIHTIWKIPDAYLTTVTNLTAETCLGRTFQSPESTSRVYSYR